MRIVLTGTEGSGIDRVERSVVAAGHTVVSCTSTTSDGDGRPCQGVIDPAACPAVAGVDLIVAARERPLPHLTRQERLVECIVLSDVPLVVVGSTVVNPFGGRATELVEGFDDVADVCARVVAAGEPAHASGG